MKIKISIVILTIATVCVLLFVTRNGVSPLSTANSDATLWQMQSVDTMKYSRDIAREKLKDQSFDADIEAEMKRIAATGATHVSIGTPYDDEFIPFLTRWVKAARKEKLNIWFRGNFSGWEEWFDYPQITRSQHIEMTKRFIIMNPGLFENGDIFTACTECENGGPGDPRATGDKDGHRKFLIDLFKVTQEAFRTTGKNVASNYFPMNGDVARLIMNKETTKALGGIVVIDHYVKSPDKLFNDIEEYGRTSGGKVVLGEFGAPIPDIHGEMTEEQQAQWLEEAFKLFERSEYLIGINYWTARGGSTSLWSGGGVPKKAVDTLTKYYSPVVIKGKVTDTTRDPITSARITVHGREYTTRSDGSFSIPLITDDKELAISADGYQEQIIAIDPTAPEVDIKLDKINKNFWYTLKELLRAYI